MGKMNQVAPIVVYNSDSDSDDSEQPFVCLCCGEGSDTAGMCLACSFANCHKQVQKPCRRTGIVDPLDLAAPDLSEITPGPVQ